MSNEDFFLDDDDPSQTLQLLSKRRRTDITHNKSRKKMKLSHNNDDSDDDLNENISFHYTSNDDLSSDSESESDQEEKETTTEKRLRLAQNYLSAITKQEQDEKIGDARADISTKLKEEAQEVQGRLVRDFAFKLQEENNTPKVIKVLRGHKLSPTCVAVSEDGSLAFSGSKDCSVIQWDIETGKKLITRGGRKYNTNTTITGQVLSVAVTSDNKYYATGGRDKLIRIWDTRSNTIIHSFSHHRNAVTCLKFRKDSYQLFSGSEDRTVKTWNLDPMMYTETLFGHQSGVMGIDSLYKERTISCGEDHTCRIWKIVEESQLLYRGHSRSIDCLSMINEESYVSGSQDGAIGLWHAGHKKPNYMVRKAHGQDNWITSIKALPFTDLIASGSNDGNLNFWQFSKKKTNFNKNIIYKYRRIYKWNRYPKIRKICNNSCRTRT